MSDDNSFNEVEKFGRKIFGQSFHHDKSKDKSGAKVRVFTRWYFEIVRNMMVVASLQYLAKKSGSTPLLIFSLVSGSIMLWHIQTYLDPFSLWPTQKFKWKWLHATITIAVNIIVFLPIFYAVNWYLPRLIEALAQSYLSQPK